MRVLHWIGFASPPLTVAELCEAVSLQDGMDSIDLEDMIDDSEILRRCSSLIRKSHNGLRYEFAHFTVPEYLSSIDPNSPLGQYKLSRESASISLAKISLRYLSLKQFNQPPRAEEEQLDMITQRQKCHPFFSYASRNWFEGICDTLMDQSLVDLLHLFFGNSRRGCFLSWTIELVSGTAYPPRPLLGNEMLELLEAVLQPGLSSLHVAASIGRPEISRLLIEQGEEVNRSW